MESGRNPGEDVAKQFEKEKEREAIILAKIANIRENPGESRSDAEIREQAEMEADLDYHVEMRNADEWSDERLADELTLRIKSIQNAIREGSLHEIDRMKSECDVIDALLAGRQGHDVKQKLADARAALHKIHYSEKI